MRKKIFGLFLGLFFTSAFLFNLHAMTNSQDNNPNDFVIKYHWADNQLCGDGNTFKRCQLTGGGDECSTYNATDPNPSCPDSTN